MRSERHPSRKERACERSRECTANDHRDFWREPSLLENPPVALAWHICRRASAGEPERASADCAEEAKNARIRENERDELARLGARSTEDGELPSPLRNYSSH